MVRTQSNGVTNQQNFALIIEGADSAEIRDEDGRKNGYTFFSSQISEAQIQLLQHETEKQMQTNNGSTK